VLVAAVAAWVIWKWLPNDEGRIRQTMLRLVEAASVKPDESGFTRLSYPDRLAAFFTTNATLNLEGLGRDVPFIASRTDLLQVATAARTFLRQAEFNLADLHVTFPAEKSQANAYVVITGQINSDTNRFGQAFRMALQKVNGRWLIHEVITVERQ
jgi:hypothetical protein